MQVLHDARAGRMALVLAVVALGVFALPAMAAAAPAAPAWTSPAGGCAARLANVTVVPGAGAATMTVSINGVPLATVDCSAGAPVSFGTISMPPGVSTFTCVEADSAGETSTSTYTVRRLEYPWPTCIVIDKSDYRLYWIRNNVLVRAYPIAHGKRTTPTPNAVWKVGRKEITYYRGVYGPRKLRLFRRIGYNSYTHRYVYKFTRYGVHGTNQPWVIGTMASHGCIRLYNRDILQLWAQVPVGTPVLTRP